MSSERMMLRAKVAARVAEAKGVAWDGCHKIYILMDVDQMHLMRQYGYGDGSDASQLWGISTESDTVDMVMEWYERSCSLRFIEAVSTNEENPNAGFESVIAQFEEDYEDEEEF